MQRSWHRCPVDPGRSIARRSKAYQEFTPASSAYRDRVRSSNMSLGLEGVCSDGQIRRAPRYRARSLKDCREANEGTAERCGDRGGDGSGATAVKADNPTRALLCWLKSSAWLRVRSRACFPLPPRNTERSGNDQIITPEYLPMRQWWRQVRRRCSGTRLLE